MKDATGNIRARWARWRERHGKRAEVVYVDELLDEDVIYCGGATPEQMADPHMRAKTLGRYLEDKIAEIFQKE